MRQVTTVPGQTLALLNGELALEQARGLQARLAREIDLLPPTLKEVFVLQVIEGVSTEEVCHRLGITEANCWVRLHRARKRLAAAPPQRRGGLRQAIQQCGQLPARM